MNAIAPAAVGYLPNTPGLRPAAGGVAVSAPDSPVASADATPEEIGEPSQGPGGVADARVREAESAVSRAEARVLEQMQREIRELAMRDREVRAHEQAHKAVGGQYAGAPSYEYQRGPDGRMYAVAGSVPIDISPIPGDPAATLQKMQQVQRAALAPMQPSAADRSIAAEASRLIVEARAELVQLQGEQVSRSPAESEEGSAGDSAEPTASRSVAPLDDYRAVAATATEQPASGLSLSV